MEDKQKENNNYSCNYYHDSFNGKLFWGLFFIVAGVLFLLQNFNLVTIKFDSLWKLWPLIIVLAGFSILSFKNIVWKIISAILIILAFLFVSYVAIYGTKLPCSKFITSSNCINIKITK